MFDNINNGLFRRPFEFQQAVDRMVVTALAQFDAIFTLHQDLLLEHGYLHNVMALSNQRWRNGYQSPGRTFTPNAQRQGQQTSDQNR